MQSQICLGCKLASSDCIFYRSIVSRETLRTTHIDLRETDSALSPKTPIPYMTIFPYGCCFEYPHFELTEEVIHVNEEMIGRWERGEHNISARYRQLLCKLFGISDE